ncbi:hypothetical protein PoB_001724000 [Plakobranchus ocellatus]|uniref:Uncharacterized protein n=1 Tax=Plakobranchus ocellatus TaxID=259542 RepID=A0AAV3Z6I1_9GAST|nr:hypothetical protein PoB_001724000 [Plakobranchus ocellatus]
MAKGLTRVNRCCKVLPQSEAEIPFEVCVEEYKCGKVRLMPMLKDSEDQQIDILSPSQELAENGKLTRQLTRKRGPENERGNWSHSGWKERTRIKGSKMAVKNRRQGHQHLIRRWNQILTWKCRWHGYSEEELTRRVHEWEFSADVPEWNKHPKVIEDSGMRPDNHALLEKSSWSNLQYDTGLE